MVRPSTHQYMRQLTCDLGPVQQLVLKEHARTRTVNSWLYDVTFLTYFQLTIVNAYLKARTRCKQVSSSKNLVASIHRIQKHAIYLWDFSKFFHSAGDWHLGLPH
jgi:hypothetical protein